jgi:hypothetical protein
MATTKVTKEKKVEEVEATEVKAAPSKTPKKKIVSGSFERGSYFQQH